MRSFLLLACLLVPALVACGDDGGAAPDAFMVRSDAPIDTPPPPPGCDYGELRDDTNDDANTSGSPEDTMLTFGTSTVLCGKLNIARYDQSSQKIDADAYAFNVAADSVLYVELYGAGLETLGEATVQIWGGTGFANLQMSGTFAGNHAALTVPLAAGTYEVYVRAYNASAPASDVSYKVKLTPDTTEAMCVPLTTGGYAEARDAATNNLGNDMISIDYDAEDPSMFQTPTASTTDQPEPTGLTIAATGSSRFSGSAEVTNPIVASYKDRDTFEFTTGATTNEITIRAAWMAATADLDMFLFEKPMAGAMSLFDWASSATTADGPSEEYITTAVKPNTTYWLWLGTYKDSTGAAAYSTTICGKAYTPPTN